MFTQSQPDYGLKGDGTSYAASRGSAGSWHFILDVPAGAEVVLEKVGIGSGAHPLYGSPMPLPEGMVQSLIMNREGLEAC